MTCSGAYSIKCKINNKRYIGESVNIPRRWSVHKHYLRNNSHKRKRLQLDWNLHGEDNFVFETLESCDLDVLRERGQYYMDYYQCINSDKGYNRAPLSTSTLGMVKGPLPEAHRKNCGEAIRKVWKEHPEKFLKNRKSMSKEGRAKTSIRFKNLWKDENFKKQQQISRSLFASTKEGKERIMKANRAAVKIRSKTFVVESPEGKIWLVTNLAKFCREFDLKRSSMGDVVKGRAPACHGWKARHATEKDLQNTNFILYTIYSKSRTTSPTGKTGMPLSE